MALRIIIPVKPFAEAKQRLAPVLTRRQRATLAERMFQHVFATALRLADAPGLIVITRATEILALAEAKSAVGLMESGAGDLNSALAQASDLARASGASKLLILASDLPLLREEHLVAMARHDCAIAPDRHGHGTNALLWPAHPSLGFCFGENSFRRHCAIARAAGLDPQIMTHRGLAHDVDVPKDLIDTSGFGL